MESTPWILDQLNWIIPVVVTLMLTAAGYVAKCFHHVDQCMHRMETKRSEADAKLHTKIDDVAQRLSRVEGRLDQHD